MTCFFLPILSLVHNLHVLLFLFFLVIELLGGHSLLQENNLRRNFVHTPVKLDLTLDPPPMYLKNITYSSQRFRD